MKHEVFIAWPFVYRAGDDFHPYEGEASGVFFLEMWKGTSVSIDGITIIAPGYESRWMWDLWSRSLDTPPRLEPLDAEAAIRELAELQDLLTGTVIEGKARKRWSYAGDGPVHIRFTEAERSLVLEFLENARGALESGLEAHTE